MKLKENLLTAQKCKTGSPLESGKIEETFSSDAIKVIGDWILGNTK